LDFEELPAEEDCLFEPADLLAADLPPPPPLSPAVPDAPAATRAPPGRAAGIGELRATNRTDTTEEDDVATDEASTGGEPIPVAHANAASSTRPPSSTETDPTHELSRRSTTSATAHPRRTPAEATIRNPPTQTRRRGERGRPDN
jgi:hypothetical protein